MPLLDWPIRTDLRPPGSQRREGPQNAASAARRHTPEELDVFDGELLERLEVAHSWAGLRNFVADRSPVIGASPDDSEFFWLAAQRGHGIQIAPAAARLAAALVRGDSVPDDLSAAGFDPAWVSPARPGLDSGQTGSAELFAKC